MPKIIFCLAHYSFSQSRNARNDDNKLFRSPIAGKLSLNQQISYATFRVTFILSHISSMIQQINPLFSRNVEFRAVINHDYPKAESFLLYLHSNKSLSIYISRTVACRQTVQQSTAPNCTWRSNVCPHLMNESIAIPIIHCTRIGHVLLVPFYCNRIFCFQWTRCTE